MVNFYALSALINGLASSALGIFVYFKNKQGSVNKSYGITTVFIGIWSYSYFFWQISTQESHALFWCRALMVGAIFIPPSYLNFIVDFLGYQTKKRKAIIFGYTTASIFLILNFSSVFIKGVSPKLFFKYWPDAGGAYIFFLILVYINNITHALILLFREYKNEAAIKRAQIRYVIIGALLGFGGGATNFPLWYNIPIPPVGNILLAGGIGIMAYAVIRYRLMDINIVLTRTGIFIFVYLLVLGIPFWIGYQSHRWYYSTAVMGILATLGPFLYLFLQRRTEDILFKDQHRYQQALVDLSKTMGRIRDLDKLYKTIVLTVYDTVKVPFAAIYLKDEEHKSYTLKHYYPKREKERFQEFILINSPLINILNQQKRPLVYEEIGYLDKIKLDHGLVIPCFIEDDLLGFLILGPKPNNQMYTQDDLLVFETLSYATSLAIENCKFWKEIEDRQRKARLEEMDTFAYSLAHEIDNPMTIMLNLSNFLKNHFLKYITDPKEQKEVEDTCSFLIEASKRVSGMVKAIRQFGEKTTGELAPLRLQEVIDGYCKLFFPELKANYVQLVKEIPEEPIYIKGVAAELQQVLIILSKNSIHAMKYSETKKITLKVTKVNQDTARIAFSDTGYGIKPEKVDAIFAPFVTSKASTEGTGMGLYNAKGFIIRHKGKIWAESDGENKGATFIIELPTIKSIKAEELPKKDERKWKF
jgi:signal transduction histidine kinase